MTDYDAPGFAQRYTAGRPLDSDTTLQWTRALQTAVPPGLSIITALDLGAGTGRFWPIMREAWHPERIVAVDRSRAMLESNNKAHDVETRVADIDEMSIEDFRAQAVLCSMSLHYSVDPALVCRRLVKVLAPGGVLCVRTSTREAIGANAVLRFFPSAIRAEHKAFPERAVIETWLSDAGFSTRSETVSTPAAPSYRRLVARAGHRGVPSLQLVPTPEFVVGLVRLAAWSLVSALRRRALPHDQTLLVIGVAP